MSLFIALSPWIILIIASFASIFTAPGSIYFTKNCHGRIDRPGPDLKTSMLWNAYTWVLISTLVSILFIRPSGKLFR